MDIFREMRWQDILDILIVSYVIYRIFLLIRGTRAAQILAGLIVIGIFYVLSLKWELFTLNFIITTLLNSLIIVLVVLFQNDIRQALAKVGASSFFFGSGKGIDSFVIEEVVKTAERFNMTNTGALIVFERDTGLKDYVEGGVKIDGKISSELLISIFDKSSPLHDGAVILKDNRVVATSCLLPLSYENSLSSEIGTRHRAGMGITKETDAIAIVVSEARGTIAVAKGGALTKNLTPKELRDFLAKTLNPKIKKQADNGGELS